MAPVAAGPDRRPEQLAPALIRQGPDLVEELVQGPVAAGIEGIGDQLVLRPRAPAQQAGAGLGAGRRDGGLAVERLGRAAQGRSALLAVGDPLPSPLGALEPGQEVGDDLVQLAENHVGVTTGLGQLVRPHPQDELLVRLGAAEDPDIGNGGRGEQAAGNVERCGPGGAAGGLVILGERRLEYGLDRLVDAVVSLEQAVERGHVGVRVGPGHHLGVAMVAVLAAGLVAVIHVAGGLLQVAHQAAALEDLGEQVGDLFAAEVDPRELGHGVVTVTREHAAEEVCGASHADLGPCPLGNRDVEELVEEYPPDRLGGAAVAGEQGRLGRLRESHQHRRRTIHRGEVPGQGRAFGGLELGRDGGGHLSD